jgi:hypothetical protein
MRTRRKTRRHPGSARKGSTARVAIGARRPARQGRLSERGRTTTEGVAKRRLRSIKRETGGGRQDVLARRAPSRKR